ncbi:Fibronectin type III domain-containing protein [Actinoplanes derwentensis]|uniref:Fibronectin type III domain-containing protein n=1 Tax=Actinoplanes derwentensis TaxID=113562 RepID=A0A1H1YMB5_9ACTN|nr:alpha-L-arabinofuranosidase [Actinoplanes derwentensis]SDT22593.1 Fibronectin type III domain-containing protein [Actinoplanes derwentensis]
MHTSWKAIASTVLLAAATAVVPSSPATAVTTSRVDVDVRAGLATVGDVAVGVNHAIWDSQLGTPAVADLLGDAGVTMLRYPGGSYADIYHWRDHTAPGGYVAPNTDFDTFMAGARRTGAEPMIIANYGTGTAQEAADWVRYANITKDYDVEHWTIGNENYGNGHYGSAWEADDHADKSPREYATTLIAYADAMKAVDPDIKIGAVLTMPGNWPDNIVGAGDQGSWNQEVLTRAGSVIDFVDVHWYPGGATPAETLTKPAQITDAVHLLRGQLRDFAGDTTGRIGISMTETNVEVGRNTQPGALFLADVYSGLLAQGVFTVHWWNTHNGLGTVSEVAGHTDYGDYGLLSSGNCNADSTVCQPPLNTPFAPYHALSLVGDLARPGARFIAAGSDNDKITAHAVRRANGDVALLLINKDPDAAQSVSLNYHGFTPAAGTPTVSTYTNGAETIVTGATGSATTQTLAPYSISLLTLHPNQVTTTPPAPRKPTATVTDRGATISWPAGAAGLKYEVYRQNGGAAELLGETTATTLTVGNLQPGHRYTVNVVARDTAGRLSAPSPPLTFTTATPAAAGCTVKFRDVNDWGNGYVGQVDITNNTTAAVGNWTLTFDWPTGWQTLSSGWNATWTQTARTVRVVGDGSLAAGATTSTGFVGNYSGPNVLPTVFTLNGTVCTSA